jgi:crossover junction endonuclease MUS81
MTKAQLIEEAQPYCDSSFTAPPDPTKFYTAWNSMKTLAQKDLVYEHGRPLRRYALTEEGWEVAKRIQKTLPGAGQNTLSFGTQSVCVLSIDAINLTRKGYCNRAERRLSENHSDW